MSQKDCNALSLTWRGYHVLDVSTHCSTTSLTIYLASVDYELLHHHMGHPSKEVLKAAQKHTKDFPDVEIPKHDLICPGCQLGKRPNQSFPHTKHRASIPFELIHLDIKSFKVGLYHKYKYAIVFYDDYTSMTWVGCLQSKD